MITVQFKDLEDMLTFANQLVGMKQETAPSAGTILPAPDAPAETIQKPLPASPAEISPVARQTAAPAPMPAPTPAPTPVQAHTAASASASVASTPTAVQASAAPQTAATVPTSSTQYTLDDLARAAMTLMDTGRQGDLLSLLSSFGVAALPALQPEQFGAFATALRGLGAQI